MYTNWERFKEDDKERQWKASKNEKKKDKEAEAPV